MVSRLVSIRRRGFTLIEVMVALMIMAIIAVTAWQGVDGIMRSRQASQERLDQTLRMGTVIAQWEHDLSALQDTGALPSALAFDGANLRLTRRTEQGVQLVVWSLRPGSNGGAGVLQRWAGTPVVGADELQEAWMRSQQFQGNEPGQVDALSGVTAWRLYCHQGSAWANCQSTGNVQGDSRIALPRGLRLVLSFAEGSGLAGDLTRDVALPPPYQ